MNAIEIVSVETPEQLAQARELFLEYGQSIRFHICFDGFQEEAEGLPGCYAPPAGRLLVAMTGGAAVGCVALKNVSEGVGEIKRLYVRPPFRGTGIGRRLAERVLNEARRLGYHAVRLDTLPSMKEAQGLYHSLGFKPLRTQGAAGSAAEPIDMEMSLR